MRAWGSRLPIRLAPLDECYEAPHIDHENRYNQTYGQDLPYWFVPAIDPGRKRPDEQARAGDEEQEHRRVPGMGVEHRQAVQAL